MDEEHRKKIVELALSQGSSAGPDITIDADAKVSEGEDNGAYVQAWVWCSFEGTEFDKEKEAK